MMKTIRFVAASFMFLAITIAASGQSVASIPGKVAAINKNVKKYKKVKKDVADISTEGAEATYYHDQADLKKIYARIYGETFNAVTSLYFENDKPLYIEFRNNRYNTQIGLSKPVKVVKVEIKKYFFADGELVKLMVGTKVIARSSDRYTELRDEIIKIADDLKAAFAKVDE